MDLLKRQEIVIEKSTELKQLVGLALSLDECEEFVSDVLKASYKPSNCILGDVSKSEKIMLELRFTLDNNETELFRITNIPPRVGDFVWWGEHELEVMKLFWNLEDSEETYIIIEVRE